MVSFGENLTTWMTANNVTNAKLSPKTGIPYGRLTEIESDNSKPTDYEIAKIAKFFEADVETFTRGCSISMCKNDAVSGTKKGKRVKAFAEELVSEAAGTDMPAVKAEDNTDKKWALTEAQEEVMTLYENCPAQMRQAASSRICDFILARTKMNAAAYESAANFYHGLVGKYKKRTAAMTRTMLERTAEMLYDGGYATTPDIFFQYIRDYISMFTANYNFNVAQKKYGFIATSFSKLLGLNETSVSRWLNYYDKIPAYHIETICRMFHVDAGSFTGSIYTQEKLPDLSATDIPDSVLTEKKASKKPVPANAAPKKAIRIKEAASDDGIFSNPRLAKMYARLSEEHRNEVDALIEQFFWEDI